MYGGNDGSCLLAYNKKELSERSRVGTGGRFRPYWILKVRGGSSPLARTKIL